MLRTIDVGWCSFYLTLVGIILMLVLWKKRGPTKGGLLLGSVNIVVACISIYAIVNYGMAYDSSAVCLFIVIYGVALVLETIQGTKAYIEKPRKEKVPKGKKDKKWGTSKKEEKVEPITFPQ